MIDLFIGSETANAIITAAHSSWNAGCIDDVLDKYVEDLIYVSNTGPDGTSFTIHGKQAFREKFVPAMSVVDSKTTITAFRFEDGIARVRLSAFVRHRQTGHELTGTFRQMFHFRGFQICKLEDYHDAAKITAFWRMVEMDMAELRS